MTSAVVCAERLPVERLGSRGEGIASGSTGPIYVPYALPGDIILADVAGERGRLIEIVRAGQDRVAPFCPHYGRCGGCAVQALAADAYARWKQGILIAALARAGIAHDVEPLLDAHGEGRRRATFHARSVAHGSGRAVRLGFMAMRSHEVVDIAACPILAPSMSGAVTAARAIADTLVRPDKPLDSLVTGTPAGLDLDLRGCGPLSFGHHQALVEAAERLDLARVSNHGEIVIERRAPMLAIGSTQVAAPPGAFLQATDAGEKLLSRLVIEAVLRPLGSPAARRAGRRPRVADLFCGIGTFALRLSEYAEVRGVDADAAALGALARAARKNPSLQVVATESRDLFRRPLSGAECEPFDAVVFDPPRAGAPAQARELAASGVASVVAVSCNPASFARDARILVDGGYAVERITPVDQFRHSPHVEVVGVFRRPKQPRRQRALLG
ncbi:MAG: class I SAM-dependent RNA methyltransferase [Methylobacteriaceae bacterium]|nr:class I SAM-dependent RNA methyltransferase [Methylobacteriaceae bacterium]